MATKKKSLPLPQTEQVAVQAIIKLLDESRAPTYMHTFEHFNRALGIWESALRLDPMAQWLEATRGLEFGLEPLAQALAILMDQAQRNYYDIIGNVYMELGQGDKRFGQYFTPWSVAKMMARMTLSDFKPPEPGEPPLTFYEPCVGSGIMILAAAETIEERCPGAIARGEVAFYGQDKDPCCVAMCRLNMFLHKIGRLVQRIEDLTVEQRRLLERLLGRRLPRTGALVDDPVLSVGDALLRPYAPSPAEGAVEGQQTEREPERQDAVVVAAEVEGEEEAPGPDTEMVVVPALVAQDLWAALDAETTSQVTQNPPLAPRRKGSRGANRRPAEYTPGLLFSPQDE
jgi:N-6 DNA Methylase